MADAPSADGSRDGAPRAVGPRAHGTRGVVQASPALRRPDIVHNNVGIGTGDGWAENIELAAERIMRVNAGSALLMAKAAVPA